MHIKALMSLLIGTILHGTSIYSQASFRHYQVENGLSHNTVLCSLQDEMGFMWFGTKDGLNRFDGYSFKTFRSIPNEQKGMGNSYISALCKDKDGTIWIGTHKGLYRYLNTTEAFCIVPEVADIYVSKMIADGIGNIWFISGYELYKFSMQTHELERYDRSTYFVATSICATEDGTVYIGTNNGLLKKYDASQRRFSTFDLFQHSNVGANRWIDVLHPAKNGKLIAGTNGSEIKMIDLKNYEYKDVTIPHVGQSNLYIRCIEQTGDNEFWIGTESGVFVYNSTTGMILHLEKDYNNLYSLTDNAIYTFCRDKEEGLWIGTYFGGINYYQPQFSFFDRYFPSKDRNSIGGNVVREIQKDQYGNLWIGTEDAGLNKISPESKKITKYQPDGTAGSISFFNVHGLLATGNELWIGTFNNGLDVLNLKTGLITRPLKVKEEHSLHSDFFYCFYQLNNREILIGTNRGIYTVDQRSKQSKILNEFPIRNFYTFILKDHKGWIWTSTFGNGVRWFDPATGQKGNFTFDSKDSTSLSSNHVNAIFEDSEHQLWFTTESGLCKWNPATSTFKRYGTTDGFPSDFMYCMLEDSHRQLWISTTKGLVQFDPTSGKIEVYTTSNGLLTNQFNYNSAYKDADGRMYFGSVKGLISFMPEAFYQRQVIAPVYLTGFHINGKEVGINNPSSPLTVAITYTNTITLAHDQSTISINFAALNYSAPELIRYVYQMEGLSNRWIDLKENRRVDFIGLSPGIYHFRIKALKGNNLSGKITDLTIYVLPPWWKSSWASTVYALLLVLSLYLVVRFYFNRIKERNNRNIEFLKSENEKEKLQLALLKEKELADAKVEFFTNVAHEIRTPLTLIKVPLQKVVKRTAGLPEIENSVSIMVRNTDRLIEITTQLLDFQKAEIDKFRLSLEKANITALLKNASADFSSLAEQYAVSVDIQIPEEPFMAFVDKDAFHKILYNLYSNAIKYASKNVRVELIPFYEQDATYTILFTNDGEVIPLSLREKIFEPFFRVSTSSIQAGTGIGLALARSLTLLHKGTLTLEPCEGMMNVFKLTLPVTGSMTVNEGI